MVSFCHDLKQQAASTSFTFLLWGCFLQAWILWEVTNILTSIKFTLNTVISVFAK